MKLLGIVIVVATALVTLFSHSASHATTRARTLAETVFNGSPVRLSAGRSHTCQVNDDGTVRCWGDNGSGQLGDGTTTTRLTPVSVSFVAFGFGPTSVVAIAAGRLHTCALLADGSARCWGGNGGGQLGNGTTSSSLTPTTVAGGGGSVTARDSAAGSRHTCAVRADSTVSCWGDNGNGQLGDGTTTDRLTPIPVSGLTNAVAIAAGHFHTGALVAGRGPRVVGIAIVSVHCWGGNGGGQLGDGTTTDRLTPVPVSGLTSAVAIAAGGAHTCALLADGSVNCWGFNSSGQLGNGTTSSSLTPTTVAGGGGSVTARDSAAGSRHTCAVRADSTVSCWGDNGNGQLGDGTTTDRLTPIPVSGLTNAVAIAAGRLHTCALLANSSVHCWGFNGSGQLGNSTTTTRLAPAPSTSSPTLWPLLLGSLTPARSSPTAARAAGVITARVSSATAPPQIGSPRCPSAVSPTLWPLLLGVLTPARSSPMALRAVGALTAVAGSATAPPQIDSHP